MNNGMHHHGKHDHGNHGAEGHHAMDTEALAMSSSSVSVIGNALRLRGKTA